MIRSFNSWRKVRCHKGCGLFLEEKSLVRVFIPRKPDDECNRCNNDRQRALMARESHSFSFLAAVPNGPSW
jgi:hypothetical protein